MQNGNLSTDTCTKNNPKFNVKFAPAEGGEHCNKLVTKTKIQDFSKVFVADFKTFPRRIYSNFFIVLAVINKKLLC